tara:strand:+ start:280 stop:525 length:246 start_codon:yes stop_codon:yes gene_type:complete
MNTLEGAIDKSLDTPNALRNEIAEQDEEAALTKAQYEIETKQPKSRSRMISENMVKSRKVNIKNAFTTSLKKSKRKLILIY